MKIRFITIDEYADIYAAMSEISTTDAGATIAHAGHHAEHGSVVLIQNAMDSGAILVGAE